MNPLRRIAALPLALVLFWTMVVAPWTMARCEHACGETRWHALGGLCSDEDKCCDCGHDHRDADGKTGSAGDSPACSPFKADSAPQPDHMPALKTPPPVDFIPVYPVSFVSVIAIGEPLLAPCANAPPDIPPKETHGRGALPLLI
jgi:hypothetical protein